MKNTGFLIATYLFLASLVLLVPVLFYAGGAYLIVHFVRKFW